MEKQVGMGSRSSSDVDNVGRPMERIDSIESINTLNMTRTISGKETMVEGTSRLYTQDTEGKYERHFVPMPTASPKDPLNLPTWRKVVIVSSVCFFGAMAIAPEAILAALLPVFVFEYAGLDPHLLDGLTSGLPQAPGGGVTLNPLSGLDGPPYWKISLISTLPVLVIGISNYITIPLSIAIGRRPVIIVCGLMAWVGAIWAGNSTSLDSHLGARSLQAIGAGTVETLIPLIVQDMVFIHWRNRCFSAIWASQGIIIVTLGICSPIIISNTSWRWLYFITAILAALSWILICFTLPETRFFRSAAEMRGEACDPIPKGDLRPPLNPIRYGHRTWKDEYGIFSQGIHWSRGWESVLASFKSFFFPNIFFVIILNGLFAAVTLAAGQTGALVLLTRPYAWPFRLLGLAVLPIVIASFFVAIFAGWGADKISNFITKKFRKGLREPEVHLVNLIVPMIFAIIGCVMFGIGGTDISTVSWGVFVVGIGFLSFGLLSANVIFSTYVVESFPEWAGPVLVNVASVKNIIGFGFSFRVSNWVSELGFLRMFGVYAGCIALLSLGMIPLYIWGRQIRKMCGKYIWEQELAYGNIPDSDQRLFNNEGAMIKRRKNAARASTENKVPTEKIHEAAVEAPTRGVTQPRRAPTTSNAEPAPEKKKGVDWAKVREYLNMRDSWRDPPMG